MTLGTVSLIALGIVGVLFLARGVGRLFRIAHDLNGDDYGGPVSTNRRDWHQH